MKRIPEAGMCRRASLEDLPALLALEALFPGDRLSRRSFVQLLRRPNAYVWVVEDPAGNVLGNLVCITRRDTPWWRVYSVVVHPQGRGCGYGRQLMVTAMRAAGQAGAAGLRLEVREDNIPARALYAALGFVAHRRRPGYYDDGEAALQLQWRVAP